MPVELINGFKLHFEVRGSGEPLLFIHGLGSSGRDREPQVEHFSSSHTCVTFDARGHGSSGRPPSPYSIELFADDTRLLLDHLGLRSAHVVGISMGGMIAFQLALAHSEYVTSMVIINSAPEMKPRSPRDRFQVWRRLLIVRLLGMRKMAEFLAPRLFPDPLHRHLRAEFIERWSENDKRSYLASMRAIVGWGVADRIAGINVPTLFVSADHDYTPIEAKRRYVEYMPNARLVVVENSHHAVPVERPRELNRVIEGFLSGR